MSRMAASMSAMGSGRGVGTILVTLGFWVAVIIGSVLGTRQPISQGTQARPDAAPDVPRQRYAHGELNREKFEARTSALGER